MKIAKGEKGDVWADVDIVVLRLRQVESDVILSYTREIREGGDMTGMGNIMKLLCEGFKIEDWTLFA
jgi:hypothetical protein